MKDHFQIYDNNQINKYILWVDANQLNDLIIFINTS